MKVISITLIKTSPPNMVVQWRFIAQDVTSVLVGMRLPVVVVYNTAATYLSIKSDLCVKYKRTGYGD